MTNGSDDDLILAKVAAPEIDYALRGDLAGLWEAVATLSKIEQEIVTLKYQNDFAVKEIAHKLNKSENAIKLTLSRARNKLRQHYQIIND